MNSSKAGDFRLAADSMSPADTTSTATTAAPGKRRVRELDVGDGDALSVNVASGVIDPDPAACERFSAIFREILMSPRAPVKGAGTYRGRLVRTNLAEGIAVG